MYSLGVLKFLFLSGGQVQADKTIFKVLMACNKPTESSISMCFRVSLGFQTVFLTILEILTFEPSRFSKPFFNCRF